MAGIFDDIMDGINAKQPAVAKNATAETTPAQPTATPTAGTVPASEKKDLHGYSKAFDDKYGDRKGK